MGEEGRGWGGVGWEEGRAETLVEGGMGRTVERSSAASGPIAVCELCLCAGMRAPVHTHAWRLSSTPADHSIEPYIVGYPDVQI